MRPVAFVAVLVLALTLAWFTSAPAQDADFPSEAKAVVDRLFEMLDAGKLKESFAVAAPSIQKSESPALWYGHMESWRGSMGNLVERKLVSASRVTEFADLPDGQYLQVVYQTEFDTHPDSREIVALSNEDGAWGVVGYEVDYDRWPEAWHIIGSGLVIVFFIMSLLALTTWAIGRVVQKTGKKKAEAKG